MAPTRLQQSHILSLYILLIASTTLLVVKLVSLISITSWSQKMTPLDECYLDIKPSRSYYAHTALAILGGFVSMPCCAGLLVYAKFRATVGKRATPSQAKTQFVTTFAILILAFVGAISLFAATRKPHSFGLGSCQTDDSFVRDSYIFDINDPDSWVCVLNEQPGDESFRKDAAAKQCGLEWTGLINVVLFVGTALSTVILMLLVHRHQSQAQDAAELVFTRSDEAWLIYTRSVSASDLELTFAPPAYEARAEDDLSCIAARV